MKNKKLRLKKEIKDLLLFEFSNAAIILLMISIYYLCYILNLL